MTSQLEVLCIGDAIIDAFLSIHDASVHCHINETTRELCFKSGDKIQLDACQFLLGGDACNVSVGFSRQGIKTALVAEIGTDEFSKKIVTSLAREGVGLTHLIQTPGASSSFAVGLQFQGERTLFVEHVKRKHNFSFEQIKTDWIYLTSLGHTWEHVYKNVLSFAKKTNAKIALSPGTLQLDKGGELLMDVVKQAEVLFVNKEEAVRIQNSELRIENEERENIRELLKKLQALGPKIVSITDGKNGSYAIDSTGDVFFIDKFPEKEIGRTGAGDGYASGFLGAIVSGLTVQDAMHWGAVNAASVVGHIGAQSGLLSKEEIESKLARHGGFVAKKP